MTVCMKVRGSVVLTTCMRDAEIDAVYRAAASCDGLWLDVWYSARITYAPWLIVPCTKAYHSLHYGIFSHTF
jgi:hypothetical protein